MVEFNHEFSVFQNALKIEDPWYVIDYELNQKDQILDVYLDFKRGAKFTCPHCGSSQTKVHDIVDDDRTWRHAFRFDSNHQASKRSAVALTELGFIQSFKILK